MKLCVIGLGYIGLPTAIMFAKHDVDVHGVDNNYDVIEKLTSGRIHIEESGLQEMLEDALDARKLSFGVTPVEADAFIISVPTPINSDKSANLYYVVQALESILPYIKEGNLIILESTVPPRTIEDVVLPVLNKSGLNASKDLYVAHSPERVLPGKLLEELVNNDRIVGGINSESSRKTAELYRSFVKGNIHVTDATTAEMVKLMENTYRDVNIAYANEMAKIAEQIGFNVWEAIELANCHPRVNIHKPGPGVGGHCIAVDPWFIYQSAPDLANLIQLSRTINDEMPEFVANMINEVIPKKSTITILGLAFKGNIDDVRESPAIEVVNQLKNDYNIQIFDPHVVSKQPGTKNSLVEAIKGTSCILLLTDHDEFKSIDPVEIYPYTKDSIVIDTRNILNGEKWICAGFQYCVLGQKNKISIKQEIG